MSVPRSPMQHADFPLADADLCVKCGLCLPHCPTYLQTRHEGDSPRGRIALMQGMATGVIPLTPRLEQHLDGCLNCRACEPVCPAKVPYGKLIDAGRRALIEQKASRGRAAGVIGFALSHRPARRFLSWLIRIYQGLGLQWLIRRLGLLGSGKLARLESLLPSAGFWPSRRKPGSTATGVNSLDSDLDGNGDRKRVMLFTGCGGDLFDQRTLADTVFVLKKMGCAIEIPRRQGCCGAIHQHAGQVGKAAALAQENLAAFAGAAPVLCSASGCGATLLDYPDIVTAKSSRQFSSRVHDINAFLFLNWPDRLKLKPANTRIAVHTPCTLKNVMGGAKNVAALLKKIPGAEVFELDAAQHCCGAAGSYFITQPDMADRLRERKLAAAADLKPDLIVSANIGCTLHLAAGLRRARIKVPVLHPVSVLARQLAG